MTSWLLRYIAARLLTTVIILIAITVVTHLLIRLTSGDPCRTLLGQGYTAGMDERCREELNLEESLWSSYVQRLGGLLQGDFGTSWTTKQPVWDQFTVRFPVTMELSVLALMLAVPIGLLAGIIAAAHRGRMFDRLLMLVTLGGYSIPIFISGLFVSTHLSGWFELPIAGRINASHEFSAEATGFLVIDILLDPKIKNPAAAFESAVRHLVMPVLILSTIPLAVIARQTRSAQLEALGQDFIRTARSKGLPPALIYLHAGRVGLLPVITTVGLATGVLMSGAILTEQTFGLNGLGSWMVESIEKRDYPAVQGGLLLIASIIIIVNQVVDVAYTLANPKLR